MVGGFWFCLFKKFKMSDCIFCKIMKGDVESEKLSENDSFFVINDLNPVSEGHCLVISKEHFETIFDMPSSVGNDLVKIVKEQGKRLMDTGLAEGIKLVNNNYEASGQVVKHFHMHIIPEKKGFNREKSV